MFNPADNLGKYARKGAPGKPKGAINAKTKVANAIWAVAAKPKNKKQFVKAVQALIDKDPLDFFERFIGPHLPRETQNQHDMAGKITVIWDIPETEPSE